MTLTHQSIDGEVEHRWTISDPIRNMQYRVLPGERLLAFAGYLSMFDDTSRTVLVYDSAGVIVSTGSFDIEVTDVRATEGGSIWVAHDVVLEGGHSRADYGLELCSDDLDLRWMATEECQLWPGEMSVLGENVLFIDDERSAPLCTNPKVRLGNAPEADGWVLHNPDLGQWAFVDDSAPDHLEVTLGWADFEGNWKPYSKGPIALPYPSPMERRKVECDAQSIHVWVGQRWYSLTLSSIFDDSVRSIPPRLPDVTFAPESRPR